MSIKDHAQISAATVWYAALIIGILIGVTFLTLYLKPTWLGLERKAFKQSHQYIEAKQSFLLKLVDEYNKLETEVAKYEASDSDHSKIIEGLRNQQNSLAKRIKSEAQLIPDKEVPQSVKNFINQHY